MLADFDVEKRDRAVDRRPEFGFVQQPFRLGFPALLRQQVGFGLRQGRPAPFESGAGLVQLLPCGGAGGFQLFLPVEFTLRIGQVHPGLFHGGGGTGDIRTGAADPGLIILAN